MITPTQDESLDLHPARLGQFRVLHADGDVVYASSRLNLLRSMDGGLSFDHLAHTEDHVIKRLVAATPLVSRLLRTGFHSLTPLPGGALVAVVRGAVLYCAPGSDTFVLVHTVTRGTRPLNVCLAPSGRLFFGEYFGNPAREEVHIYASDDGRAWDVVRTFPAGSIRHVHGIHADRYRGGVWVLTGDSDAESGVHWSGDDLATLDPVAFGSQSARAVVVLPTPDGVIVPTDTPQEQNYIQLLDPRSGALERLMPIPGSVLSAGRTEGVLVVSTAVERSAVNTEQSVALLVSRDGTDWSVLTRFPRDLRRLRDRRGYLQLPTLQLPSGTGGERVLATGQAIAGAHGQLLAWDERDIAQAMTSVRP